MLLLAITLLTDVLNLYTLNWLLNKILEVGAIALIIVFQPELRRALERVGAQLHFHLLRPNRARPPSRAPSPPRCRPARSCRVSVSASC
ncbi:MAG: hypothetical protein ACLU3I_15675 [Acutalibacteraceae bacterium]